MKILSEEKSKSLAERNGWSPAYAEGNVAGETMRRSGKALSMYALVGMDDYARGFRAGYFERQNPGRELAKRRRKLEWAPKSVRLVDAEVSTDSTDYLQNVAR